MIFVMDLISFFTTISEKIVDELVNKNTCVNSHDFKSCCPTSIKNSIIFVELTERNEVITLIQKLSNLDMITLDQS